jgi:hypothetical protein
MIKLRRVRWAGHVACMQKRKNERRHLVGEPEGKKSCETLGHRWWILLK